ncbi:hypothetical protein QN372_00080 [Undibacterium sp. RTI2.1]|uniref:hypothetical protein n=1 Tax=unclassified Undibacterium TaxID=2630295 RepID=UPI002AB5C65D|nr:MULTISPECIES: hypothetical protein [unclassified Undibacterium]MDY7537537.1 hypothetical protein [Undibacterium sp. 5I1]MEB0029135.1 hypothetical protein [Undibacterium sp. RTI2.1]MEB0115443.1 hypothetical protein [Undibacterium sp. RTI2.2]MEB0231921.1 hypothetical protein [Undibacterium sp. 10I3]MEB0256272.1 hypothetical protein [Undibacterium sp. 5I1]
MTKGEEFDAWVDEFEETLLCDFGIDVDDTGLSHEELLCMADEPAYQAVARFAEKRNLTNKNEGRFL